MDNIKKKMDLLTEAKEQAEEHAEEAKCVQESLEADEDAVSRFIHMHIYCSLLMLLIN